LASDTMPMRAENGTITGPGVFDMKAGLVQMIYALRALHELNMPARVLQFFVPIGDAEFIGAISWSVAFDIEDRGAVEKIQAADFEKPPLPSEQANEREPDWIRPRRRIEGEDAEQRQVLNLKPVDQPSGLYLNGPI
jgi:hypothetical protein